MTHFVTKLANAATPSPSSSPPPPPLSFVSGYSPDFSNCYCRQLPVIIIIFLSNIFIFCINQVLKIVSLRPHDCITCIRSCWFIAWCREWEWILTRHIQGSGSYIPQHRRWQDGVNCLKVLTRRLKRRWPALNQQWFDMSRVCRAGVVKTKEVSTSLVLTTPALETRDISSHCWFNQIVLVSLVQCWPSSATTLNQKWFNVL